MKDGKLAILATFILAFALVCGNAVAETPKLTVTVEVFSGRPNPTFEITDTAAINRLKDGLNGLPSVELTNEEGAAFGRLGYRGVVITHTGSVEGIPSYVQIVDGKVKVAADGRTTRFLKDTSKFEKYFLGMAKKKGLITELLDAQFVPDPDTL